MVEGNDGWYIDRINAEVTASTFKDHGECFHSFDRTYTDEGVLKQGPISPEDSERLDRLYGAGCLPPSVMHLAVGQPVSFIRNAETSTGICNGAVGVVVSVSKTHQCVRVAFPHRGPGTGYDIVTVHRFQFHVSGPRGRDIVRRQLPLRPVFASSYHKTQGDTLERIVLDIRTFPFCYHDVAMGLSRVSSASCILFLISPAQLESPEAPTFKDQAFHFHNLVCTQLTYVADCLENRVEVDPIRVQQCKEVDTEREAARLGQQQGGVKKVRLRQREQVECYGHYSDYIVDDFDPTTALDGAYGGEYMYDQYHWVNEDPRSESFEAAEAGTVDLADEYFFESTDDFMDDDADCYSHFALDHEETLRDLYSQYLEDCTDPFEDCTDPFRYC